MIKKPVFDKLMETLDARAFENSGTTSNRELSSLQVVVYIGKTHTLQILQQCAESKGYIVLTTTTIGISASLYENGRMLSRLLGLGVDGEDSSDATASSSSRYGVRFDRSDLLRKAAIRIVDEAYMMNCRLLEMLDVGLPDLRCYSTDRSKSRLAEYACRYLMTIYSCFQSFHLVNRWRLNMTTGAT